MKDKRKENSEKVKRQKDKRIRGIKEKKYENKEKEG